MRKIRENGKMKRKLRKTMKSIVSVAVTFAMVVSSLSITAVPTEKVMADGTNADADASESGISLPVEFIDYRADNLMFEYVMKHQNGDLYTEEFTFTEPDVLDYSDVFKIVQDTYGTKYTKGLVESTLSDDGLPVYTKEAVDYIAHYVALELNKDRNDSRTTDFYRALRANMAMDESAEGYYDTVSYSLSPFTDWTYDSDVWTVKDNGTGNLASQESDGGSAYKDFVVPANKDVELVFYSYGAEFSCEIIKLNSDGTEGEVLTSTTVADNFSYGWGNWPQTKLNTNSGELASDSDTGVKLRVKFTASGETGSLDSQWGTFTSGTEIGSDNGFFRYYGNKYTLGSYAEAKAKDEAGQFKKLSDITTCYDYAYYMLNHYFDKDTIFGNYYGEDTSIYDELELLPDENGDGYSFLANFDYAHGITDGVNSRYIVYDNENKNIHSDMDKASTQTGFFPLSNENANSKVKLETEQERPVAVSEHTYTDYDIQYNDWDTYGDYSVYAGSWSNATATYSVDTEDADHVKIQPKTYGNQIWGLQLKRNFTGLTAGQVYTVSYDIISTVSGDTYNTSLDGEKTTSTTLSTITGTKTAGNDGNFDVTLGLGCVKTGNIIEVSHWKVTDANGNIVYESQDYSSEYEGNYGDFSMEAEFQTFSGNVTAASSDDASYGGYIYNVGGTDNGSVTFTVNIVEAGTRNLKIYYMDADGGRNLGVSVNGGEQSTIACPDTGKNSWSIPGDTPASIDLNLVEGENTITLSGVNGAFAPNIDRITLELTGEEMDLYSDPAYDISDFENSDTLGFSLTEGTVNGNTQDENYHYAMKSSGKFVYQESSDLYFTFTGDDDVYLFINGQLAIDIGGAHYAVTETVSLNDLGEEFNLEDGKIYSFDFFYLERHVDYSNLRINTNIDVMDSGAQVTKAAYSSTYDGVDESDIIKNGEITDLEAGDEIDYALTMTNISELPLKTFSLKDDLINLNLDSENGTYTINGETADAFFAAGNKLLVKISWENGTDKEYKIGTIDSKDDLIAILKSDKDKFSSIFSASDATEVIDNAIYIDTNDNGDIIGYQKYAAITVSGFKYTIPDDTTIIDNIVTGSYQAYTAMFDKLESGDAGEASHITVVPVEYFVQDTKDMENALSGLKNNLKTVTAEEAAVLENANTYVTGTSGVAEDTEYGKITVDNEKANSVTYDLVEGVNSGTVQHSGIAEINSSGNLTIHNIGGTADNYTNGTDGKITFTVDSTVAGTATIDITYACVGNRSLKVTVNGTEYVVETTENSTDWDNPTATLSLTVDLKKGSNTIVLSGVDTGADSWGPNVGSVTVSNAGSVYIPDGTATEAVDEDGKLVGEAVDDNFVYVKSTTTTDADNNETTIYVAVPVTVHLYDVNEDVYVLDYGLPVNLNTYNETDIAAGTENGILANDVADDNGATYKKLFANGQGGTYGNMGAINTASATDISALAATTWAYVPTKFIEGIDNFTYTLKIRKSDSGFDTDATITTGLDMVAKVKIMPASLVYYEDNFIYTTKPDNTTTNVADTSGKHQSNKNESEYGNDEAYNNETDLSAGNATDISTAAYYDADGTYHSGKSDVVTFTFTGTGFDIIGSTGPDTPILIVSYTDNGTTKTKIVNTYYKDGEGETLEQIPVVSIKGLTNGSHTVKIMIAASKTGGTDESGNVFKLDGIRIYNPNTTSEVIDNYVVKEKNASFANVFDMLLGDGEISENYIDVNGTETLIDTQASGRTAMLVNIARSDSGIAKPTVLGYSNTEEIAATSGGLYTNSLNDYLAKGPNNEVYLSTGNALAFTVSDYNEDTTTVQVEAKYVDVSSDGGQSANKLVSIYKDDDGIYQEYEIATVATKTAMYYEIPLDKCIKSGDNYVVIIEALTKNDATLSISNIKTNNCTISLPEIGADQDISAGTQATPSFTFQSVTVQTAYAGKEATVSITVKPNSGTTFDGKFDADFDTASPNLTDSTDDDTLIEYAYSEDAEEDWYYVGSKDNGDGTYTYTYSLLMPGAAHNMSLTLSHTSDEYTYKYKTVVEVEGSLESISIDK